MEKNYTEHPAFDYLLSAFISSARSVLWIMRSEYSQVEGWEAWYDSKKPNADEETFLKIINEVRVHSEKKELLKTTFQVIFGIAKEQVTEELESALNECAGKTLDISVTIASEAPEPIPSIDGDAIRFLAKLDQVQRALKDFSDTDAVAICKEYYSILEGIVVECENYFTQ
jgi:hypothetical protein